MIQNRLRKSSRSIGLVVVLLVLFGTAVGQETGQPAKLDQPNAEKQTAKPNFVLSVKTTPLLNISLKADKVKLVDIAIEMAKRLKTQVFVGPSLQKEVVSMEFSDLTLEPAMQLMAPAVYIDYEIETGSGLAAKPLGIYFYDANSAEPPITAVVPGNNQSLLVEGDTEDGVEPQNDADKKRLEEKPLRIQYQNSYISIKAKKQPLILVLLKIGEELGIPVEIQYESTDVVDTELTKLPVEDAIRKLSPNVRLFLRVDLLHAERRLLRLVLADPTKTAQQSL